MTKLELRIDGIETDENDMVENLVLACVQKPKYSSVELCFKGGGGWNIPFAKIKLYDRDLAIHADATFESAAALGSEIARRWNADVMKQDTRLIIEGIQNQHDLMSDKDLAESFAMQYQPNLLTNIARAEECLDKLSDEELIVLLDRVRDRASKATKVNRVPTLYKEINDALGGGIDENAKVFINGVNSDFKKRLAANIKNIVVMDIAKERLSSDYLREYDIVFVIYHDAVEIIKNRQTGKSCVFPISKLTKINTKG